MLNVNENDTRSRQQTTVAQQGGAAGVPRRTIVKGIAWSVPVVVASTAIPLASASAVGCFSAATVSTTATATPVAPTPAPTSTTPRTDGHTGTIYQYKVAADYTFPGGLYVRSVVTVCNNDTVSVDPTTLVVTSSGTNWADWVQVGNMTVTITGPSGPRSTVLTGTPLTGGSHPIARTQWNMPSATTIGLIAPGECITFDWTSEATAVTSSPNPQSGFPNGRAYFDSIGRTGSFYPTIQVRCGTFTTNVNALDNDTNIFQFLK